MVMIYFLTKISQCAQTEHVKSVFSNLLGSSNGENLKLIGWNAERSLQKTTEKTMVWNFIQLPYLHLFIQV